VAALMAALGDQFGPIPPMTVVASGFGAGSRELQDRPNLTQVVLGEPTTAAHANRGAPVDGQPVVLLEANVDDVTGEVLAHTIQALIAAGAHDAWVTPIVMKKGRPAHTVHALADVALVAQLTAVLGRETGTLGVRAHQIDRWTLPRHTERVVIDDLSVRVKVSPGRVKAEHDDAVRVASITGRPVREVAAEAERLWYERGAGDVPLHLAEADPDLDPGPTADEPARHGHPSSHHHPHLHGVDAPPDDPA
jgi:hypothetical protein